MLFSHFCNCDRLLASPVLRMMKPMNDEFEQYLALCQRIYERMEREGSWPWLEQDSTPDENLVDSEPNQ